MEEFLEQLRLAVKENPDLVLEIPVTREVMSSEELKLLLQEDEPADDEQNKNS
ncbi:hypothetical protein KADA111694_08055 [Kaistella daneshvariae]